MMTINLVAGDVTLSVAGAIAAPFSRIWAVVAFAALGDGERAGELFSLLNPVNHASTRVGIHRYRVEPYAAAADVYSQEPT